MAIDGRRSAFPVSLDSFGAEHVNDVAEPITAALQNQLSDVTLALERHTLRVVQSGLAGVLTPAVSGASRPKLLYKVITTVVTGTAVTSTQPLPPFTSAEKTLFGGTPLASGNNIHLQARKVGGDPFPGTAYHAAYLPPISDFSGDLGWRTVLSTLRHGDSDLTVTAGTYVLTVMITG